MKFAHLADCHLGCWRQPEMQKANLEAFNYSIEHCIKEKVDFVIIAGDFFDTAIPSIDILKQATVKLKELKDNDIKCYVVPGSHDFSISGKTMLQVLEKAGLCIDVTLPVEEKNYFIQGLGGEKRGLEVKKISSIKNEGDAKKFKILVLHTTLTEMELPIASVSLKELPKGFDYYALGHIHQKKIFENRIAYPGALFPCSFSEVERCNHGFFFIVNVDENSKKIEIKEIPVKIKEVLCLSINADNENPQGLMQKILNLVDSSEIKDKIVTLRVEGIMSAGKSSEINFKDIDKKIFDKEAYCVLRNTSKLLTKEFELTEQELKDIRIDMQSIGNLEKEIINEMIKQKIIENKDKEQVILLMDCFDKEKVEGETNDSFETRLNEETINKLNLEFLKDAD